MQEVQNDRRTIRTKKMIKRALLELIEEKGFNGISVMELTSRADINRGTFYLHYTDKYDLLEKVENELLQEIQEWAENVDSINIMNINTVDEPLPIIVKIFEYFKENSKLIKAILSSKGDPTFFRKLVNSLENNLFKNKLMKLLKKEDMLVKEEYLIPYVLSAELGVINQWLENGMKESPEEMALMIGRMSSLGPLKAAGIDIVIAKD